METRVDGYIKRYEELKKVKQAWLPMYDLIGEFIMTRKQGFTSEQNPGEFMTDGLYDGTAPRANSLMASILTGMIWGNGAKTFRLLRPEYMPETKEVKEFFERATLIMATLMDEAESGLLVSLGEYMLDQGSFGTSGIGAFEREVYPYIKYTPWDVKTMCIDEGEDGKVDTLFNEQKLTLKKLAQRYGLESLPGTLKEKIINGQLMDTVQVIHIIEPREIVNPDMLGTLDMPFASIHIELSTKTILHESGYNQMPVFVTRFYKVLGEIYGRSPGMEALPDIMELNALWEMAMRGMEKTVTPPLIAVDDGRLGGGNINTSAGALTVIRPTGALGIDKPLYPLHTVGDIGILEPLIQKLSEAITNAFALDRLLDLNNDTRMTLGEAQIRNKIRGDSLGSLFARQKAELLTPLINRSFAIFLEKGLFGAFPGTSESMQEGAYIIPDMIAGAILSGQEVYRIQYISPAERIIKSEEIQGILTTLDTVNTYGDRFPEMADNIDEDRAIARVHELSGGTPDILRSKEEIEQIRESRRQQMEARMKMEARSQMAATAQTMAQAQATINPREG